MALTFSRQIRGWDLRRNIVNFLGEDGEQPQPCAISMEALVEHFGAGKGSKQSCLAAFDRSRSEIHQKASDKYDAQEQEAVILLRASDFP